MRLTNFLVQAFVRDSLCDKAKTAVQSLDANELSLLAVDQIEVGLAERLSVLFVEFRIEAVLRLDASQCLLVSRSINRIVNHISIHVEAQS
jgi:hypothetical protein